MVTSTMISYQLAYTRLDPVVKLINIFYRFLNLKNSSLFKCQGEGAAKNEGGHMNFQVASRGGGWSPVTSASQQGVMKKLFSSLASLALFIYIYNLNSLIVRQATKFLCFFLFLQVQKLFCFGVFIVTTFIMLNLIEN